jgi:hypothetical protein
MSDAAEQFMYELAEIPIEYRRTVARWLASKGQMYAQMGTRKRNLLDPDGHTSAMVADVLKGAAVDLMDPASWDDSSIMRASEVLADLAKEE